MNSTIIVYAKKLTAATVLVITMFLIPGCGKDDTGLIDIRDYRQDMRDLVQEISGYARGIEPGFIVIPQNGQELLTQNGESSGTPDWDYLGAIDGVGREDLFYGYNMDDTATPVAERNYMIPFLDVAESNDVEVLVTDYCWTRSRVDNSYEENYAKGYISFAADSRELNSIPAYPSSPYKSNKLFIFSLAAAKNFLYIINTDSYGEKEDFLGAIQATDYDIVIVDMFFDGSEELTSADVSSLKIKAMSGERLVLAYMSIGEAEDYRYYWQQEWSTSPPVWLEEENPDWPGNYKVRYWNEGWQTIIFGNSDSYLGKILDAGFDGVYLDIIDAFEYFEDS
jgi:cysteinyl-tRNA synthetase